MDIKRLWLYILSKKTYIGSALMAVFTYIVANPDDALVLYIKGIFPQAGAIIAAISAFLLGSGILKRDKDVTREIKIYDNPMFTERKVDMQDTRSGEARVEKIIQAEPVKDYPGKGNLGSNDF